ncbi:MAG: YkvA family protein [Lachnospirales bacterium]
MKDNNSGSLGSEIFDMIESYRSSIDIHTMSRLKRIPNVNNIGNFELFWNMLRDSKSGKYKLISQATVITFIGSILYVISPVDIIPDSMGIVGLLDDMAVIAYAIRSLYEELCAYKLWLATRDLSLKDAHKLIVDIMSEFEDFV